MYFVNNGYLYPSERSVFGAMSKGTAKKRKGRTPKYLMPRKKAERRINLLLFFTIAILGVILFVATGSLRDRRDALEAKKQHVQELFQEEKEREIELDRQKVYIHTRDYIEKKARETDRLVYDGEMIFVYEEK